MHGRDLGDSASAGTDGEVGSGLKITEIDIEREGVEGCHDTRDFRSKNLKHSAISKNINITLTLCI